MRPTNSNFEGGTNAHPAPVPLQQAIRELYTDSLFACVIHNELFFGLLYTCKHITDHLKSTGTFDLSLYMVTFPTYYTVNMEIYAANDFGNASEQRKLQTREHLMSNS